MRHYVQVSPGSYQQIVFSSIDSCPFCSPPTPSSPFAIDTAPFTAKIDTNLIPELPSHLSHGPLVLSRSFNQPGVMSTSLQSADHRAKTEMVAVQSPMTQVFRAPRGTSFPAQSVLGRQRRQMRQNEQERRVVCRECQTTFTRRQELIRHERSVHATAEMRSAHRCPSCGFTFARADALKRHVIANGGTFGQDGDAPTKCKATR
eukprot:jgi/Hompol1/6602/HPOL_000599-RA